MKSLKVDLNLFASRFKDWWDDDTRGAAPSYEGTVAEVSRQGGTVNAPNTPGESPTGFKTTLIPSDIQKAVGAGGGIASVLSGTGAAQIAQAAKQSGYDWRNEDPEDLAFLGKLGMSAAQNAADNAAGSLASMGWANDTVHNLVDQIKAYQQAKPDLLALQQQIQDLMSWTPPDYNGKYDDMVNQLFEAALNMNYNDWLDSDQYAALARRYGLSGQRAMQDTLAQVASRTGGLASSWAQSAAQQGYNDYMAQLESAARDMYGTERNWALENAQSALGLADRDYNRYLNELAQWQDQRNFAYQTLSDALDRSQVADEWALKQQQYADELARDQRDYDFNQQKYADALAQQELENGRYDTEYGDSRTDAAYKQALEKAKTLAGYGNFSGYRDLGYSDEEIAGMQAQYLADQAAARRSSGGGNRSSSKTEKTEPVYNAEGLFEDALLEASPLLYVIQNKEKYGVGDVSDKELKEAFTDYQQNRSSGNEKRQEISDVDFDAAMTMMNDYLVKGQSDRALGVAQSYYNRLTSAQKKQFDKILRSFGIAYEE
jgi:hypothetical protein